MFNLNRLSDQQLDQIIQRAKAGDNQVLQSLGLYSPIPLLSEKMRRNSMRQSQAAQSAPAQQPTVADKIAGVGSLPVPGVMREENFAEGGIVAFAGGEDVEGLDEAERRRRENLRSRTVTAESSGNPNAIGPMTRYGQAKGLMQVLDMTNRDPGFGVVPARNDTPAERVRVGDDYLNAMVKRYNYAPYGSLAYNWGPGNVDKWIKRGANPQEVPADARAYVIKTTGVDLGRQGAGGAPIREFGQQGAPAQRPQSDSYAATVEAINKDRNARLAQIRKDAEDEIKALGPSPQPGDLEAIRVKALAEAQAINEPYLREMDTLLASGKPDTERMGKENFNNSLLKASLALMTGRGKGIGGALADLGAAGGIGVDQYAAGKRNIDLAEQKHREAQLLGNKSKLELAKGDKKYADELADAQVRQDRIAANAHKAGIAQIQQSRRLSEQSLDQASDAQLRGVMGVETARIKEAGQERRDNEGRTRADNLAKQQEFKAMMDKYRMLSSAVTKAVAEAESTYLPLNKPGAPTREQVIEEARRRVLLSMDSSPEEYSELSRLLREKAGIKTLSSPAPAAAPVKTYTMDQSGKFR
jgi:hypothetical protein